MTSSSKAIALLALLILISIGALSFRSTLRDEQDRDWVTHTHLVMENLEEILIDIARTETDQRGFTLIGEEQYRKPFESGVKAVHRDIEMFRHLTIDNRTQQEALRHLESLMEERLAGLTERMEMRSRDGLAGSRAVATANHGEQMMEDIRKSVGEMRLTEENLLNLRQQEAAASSRRMKTVIVIGNSVAIFILLFAGSVIHRQSGRRTQAEAELKHINERLERRTMELSEMNTELESFSYSVAHDLRAPLRQIAGYSSVLVKDHRPGLDEEALRYLQKVQEGARKMGRLVDDLLSLSKVGRQELSVETTPLGSLLRQVVEELAPEYAGRHVEWQVEALFSAECDPALMKQVFVNLLSNAVKYTRRKEHAVIQVGQTSQNEQRVVFVRDNGAGFEMEYVGKLFGVFQRLHKARDFEGTGVGLAIVQRIIRKHGGRIWAEGKVDEGATFFFTVGASETKSGIQPTLATTQGVINVARS
jgi:signal transduction histidine kinase